MSLGRLGTQSSREHSGMICGVKGISADLQLSARDLIYLESDACLLFTKANLAHLPPSESLAYPSD